MAEPHPLNDPVMLVLREGLELQKKGDLEQAEQHYRQGLQIDPLHATGLHLLGIVLAQTGRATEAIPYLRQSVELQPKQAVNLHNLASALYAMGALNEALQFSNQSLEINPVYVGAYVLRASLLWDLGRQAQAYNDIQTALSLHPEAPDALILQQKMAQHAVVAPRASSSSNQPGGDALFQVEAGMAFLNQRQFSLAIAAFERAMALQPSLSELCAPLAWAKINGCDWHGLLSDMLQVERRIHAGGKGVNPFVLIAGSADPVLQRQCAEQYFSQFVAPRQRGLRRPHWAVHERIRVAYLSCDFHEHATAYLMAKVFELHDRSQFDITALSFGPSTECAMRTRLVNAFERFVDVDGMSDEAVVQWIEREEIDIVIDLKGFTKDARTAIFAHRPAPVAVNFLGYPGTMGSDCIDYIIGDPVVTPFEHGAHFVEKIVQLPHSYQPNDRTRVIEQPYTSRVAEGLPQDGFVFAVFNNPYKITLDIFGVWMRLLHQIPDSVVWLVSESKDQQTQLRKHAQDHGIDPARLVFARYEPQARHLARHALADLFLDTTPCNAHTTASDSLWAGLPVLTCMNQTFAGRVAASLLMAMDLSELVTHDLTSYEARALHLARHPDALADLSRKLRAHRMTQPLFDVQAYTRNLEAAFQIMYQRVMNGLPPAAFSIVPKSADSSMPTALFR